MLKKPVLSGIMVCEVANVVRLEGEVICSKRQKLKSSLGTLFLENFQPMLLCS